MSQLKTDHPVALQALLSEVLFTQGMSLPDAAVEEVSEKVNSTQADEVNMPPVGQSVEEFIYQGDKSTGILFILRYPDFPYFSPQAEEAFVKTIGALKLTKDNVAIVNLANTHNPNDFKRIMTFFEPKKITLLGVEPASLKLPEIAHNSYMKGRIATVFNTFSFEEMFADVQKKKLFWGEFKTFING